MQLDGQKKNELEFNSLKKLMVLEGVDTECLHKVGRSGSKLTVQFHTSLGAEVRAGVQEDRVRRHEPLSVWSTVSKNSNPHIFSYRGMIGGPARKDEDHKKGGLSILD